MTQRSGRYLIDTNVIIALFANETAVTESLEEAEEVFIASTVLGELYYGAQRSSKVTENRERIDQLRDASAILNCDADTASIYGMIKNILRQKGRPIPENDVWIAALALQHGLVLVTRDVHFNVVDGLPVVKW